MKRFLSVLSALVCIISVLCPYTCAYGENGYSYVYSESGEAEENADIPENPDIPDEPDTPDEPDVPDTPDEPSEEDKYVARLCICSRIVVLGHAWIYVENLTDGTLRVGCYDCPQGQGVSVGSQMFSRADGGGIYYNVEAYMGNKKGLNRARSKSMLLTREQLDTVNEKILKTNEWTPFTNCCLFATKVWNSVSDDRVAYGVFPFVTALSMIKGNEGVPEMYVPGREQVFKQRKKKDKAYLEPVKDASLRRGIG